MNGFILVLTTIPDRETGEKIAHTLVKKRLAACLTLSAPSQSFYWWKGEIAEDKEYVCFIKTKEELYEKLEKEIQEIHPYDVPEIIVLPILKGSADYLEWIDKETI